MESLALGCGVVALVIAWMVQRHQADLERKIIALQGEIARLSQAQTAFSVVGALTGPATESVLCGHEVALAIRQDHPLPVLATLIKERLEAEDAVVRVIDEGGEIPADGCLIAGRIQCNGYSDVFYEATLTIRLPSGSEIPLLERPPSGARQVNLASAVVKRLRDAMLASAQKEERRRALDELDG